MATRRSQLAEGGWIIIKTNKESGGAPASTNHLRRIIQSTILISVNCWLWCGLV